MTSLCHVSELDLFTKQPMQISVLDSKENIYNPLTSLDSVSNISFFIPGSSEQFIDLNSICLRLKLQILKNDSTPFKEIVADKVDKKIEQPGFINNIIHSLFKNVRVSFNGTVVSDTPNYNYKAFIDCILNSTPEQQNSALLSQGFVKDNKYKMDNMTGDNSGLVTRKLWTDDSAIIELFSKINCDVFQCPRLLLNGVNIDLVFTLESIPFVLMYGSTIEDPIIKIHEAQIYCRHVTVNPNVMLSIHRNLHTGNNYAVYPFNRSTVKTFTIPKGLNSLELNNIYSGLLPTNFVMAFIENDSFCGLKEKNPYNFQPFSARAITFTLNGSPIRHFEQSTNTVMGYSKTYSDFLKANGLFQSDKGSLCDRDEYRKNLFLIMVDLSARQALDYCEEISKEGTIAVNIKFNSALAQTITVLFYAEFNSAIKIDKNLNVTT